MKFPLQALGKIVVADAVFCEETNNALQQQEVRLAPDAGNVGGSKRMDQDVKFGLDLFRLFDSSLGFDQNGGLEINAVFRYHFLLILAQNQVLKGALALREIGLDDDDILKIATVVKLE